MITIWPYLRLSVGFQGHFQVSLGGERRMSSFLSHSGRSPGDPRSQLSKNLPTASLLPLFLSFSPCSTTSADPSIGKISILHRISHANTKPNFIQSRLGQQKTASPSPLLSICQFNQYIYKYWDSSAVQSAVSISSCPLRERNPFEGIILKQALCVEYYDPGWVLWSSTGHCAQPPLSCRCAHPINFQPSWLALPQYLKYAVADGPKKQSSGIMQ